MDISGYCYIKKDATTGVGTKLETFIGKRCRVIEFTREGDVLVVNSEANGMATFDAKDVRTKFECTVCGDYIMPPNLNMVQQTIYMGRIQMRKGGYNNILKEMVIEASLHKGVFNDNFLWAKQ